MSLTLYLTVSSAGPASIVMLLVICAFGQNTSIGTGPPLLGALTVLPGRHCGGARIP